MASTQTPSTTGLFGDTAAWVKSSHSDASGNGNCVEVCSDFATSHHTIGVRDSKDPHGPRLHLTPTAWAAFLTATTSGEFDTV
ncbi:MULTISPECIES: DUF397 domain-containing protein [Kitasatospora]|uniref:DUF397 domain-containing protein n=1 Tax=Kitasatospora setae (strain ATCC 33774 / DSM 43861 / JCM 3304 / KCC A-0304 / NBRC 14216 / KM-6054) TaxID=452652 RepID=E4N0W5_KITSK|nr:MULTISPECIES: DUF397 domain-containing protein [Kitasatospora]BAJ31799.1 hypothetical protein KSE_60310 [Kitasatospora setae KM-6054]